MVKNKSSKGGEAEDDLEGNFFWRLKALYIHNGVLPPPKGTKCYDFLNICK